MSQKIASTISRIDAIGNTQYDYMNADEVIIAQGYIAHGEGGIFIGIVAVIGKMRVVTEPTFKKCQIEMNKWLDANL